jgi:hypothetical protein
LNVASGSRSRRLRATSKRGTTTPRLVQVEHPAALRSSSTFVVFSLLSLVVINTLWFNGFHFHSLMGDDLYAWAYYGHHQSFHDLFLTASGGKYRPVVNAALYVLFHQFGADYQAWVTFSVGLNFVIACLVFALVRRVTRGDTLIAFLAGVLYITSRFSYYDVFQTIGVMEALCIMFLVAIMYVAVEFAESDSRWPGYTLAGLYLLITLTHERFLALFPFLVLLVLFRKGHKWRSKGVLIGLICVPPVLNIVLKHLVFHTSFLTGTGGQALGFDPGSIITFMTKGFANMFWVNWGPDYLSGITMSEVSPRARLLVILIVVSLAAVIVLAAVRVLRLKDRGERLRELKVFVLWLALFVPLLLMASITFRQEYRWLYAPFVVCLVYFCYQFSRLPGRAVLKYAVIAVLAVMAVGADSYFKQHENSVYFFYGESLADATYTATVGRYGTDMSQMTMYVQKRPDIEWVLGGTLFLSPYLGLNNQKIVWVDDLKAIDLKTVDRTKSLFFQMDPATGALADVTSQILHK